MNLAVVVPFLNEETYLPTLLASIAEQTRPPDRLLLVDDGSTDSSYEIASTFAQQHAYATTLRRALRVPGRDRLADAHEFQSFQWAVDRLDTRWDVVAKVDADVWLSPKTFETLADRFASEDNLGLAGACLSEPNAEGNPVRLPSRVEHVEGATKFYRRACYIEISPIPPILGWDTLDEFRARMRGWRTESYEIPGGDPLHLRPMGSYDGALRRFRRWGVCSYGYGAHPLHVLLYGFRLMRIRSPRVLGGCNYLLGWAAAALRRAPRAEAELRAVVRKDQLDRIERRFRQLARVSQR